MASNSELHPDVYRRIKGALEAAGLKPIAFAKKPEPFTHPPETRVFTIDRVDARGNVRFCAFEVRNLFIHYLGHWELSFREVRGMLPGVSWHEF